MEKCALINSTRITVTFIAIGLVFSLILPYSFVVAQQTPFQLYQPPSSYSPFPQPPQYPSQEQYNSQSQPQNPSTTMATAAVTVYDDFNSDTYSLRDGQYSPNGKWLDVYGGYGIMGVPDTGTNKRFLEQPMTSTSPGETHASLAVNTNKYSDFQMTLNMMTSYQLRRNSPPNPWETAWIFWHYTDNYHYYALVLKTNGFQIEKKDNNNNDDSGELYLVTTYTPKVKLGQWQTVTIRHEGSSTGTPHIQVWVDGIKAADFIDNKIPNSYKMSSGYMGLYNEDSRVNFDNVNIGPL